MRKEEEVKIPYYEGQKEKEKKKQKKLDEFLK